MGRAAVEAYRGKIDEALQAISQNPQLGQTREDLSASFLAYTVGSHVIVYRARADAIGIARILHQRMSLAKHV